MGWTSYYQAVGGAGRLSRILKETKQKLLLTDAVINELPDPEKISLSRSWASLSGNKDSLSNGISRNINDTWKLPIEPYPLMKLWLKFNSGLRLKDWSHNSHIAKIKTTTKLQPIKKLVQDDGITEGAVYNIFDGNSQWVEVEDQPGIRLSDMLLNDHEVNMAVYLTPFSGATLDADNYADLFYKIDSDEVAYGYRARIKNDGSLRFTIIDNYDVQEVTTAPGVVDVWTSGDFNLEDFDTEDYNTSGDAYQSDPDIVPTNWKILSFSYNLLTRQLSIWSATIPDPVNSPNTVTVTQHAVTTTPQNTTSLSMNLPITEGSGTILHDASGLGNNGTFVADPNAPTWDPTTKYLVFSGDNKRVSIPNSASLNTLSSFTIAFKLRLSSYSTTAVSDIIMGKDVSATGDGVNGPGAFIIYMFPSGIKTLAFTGFTNAAQVRTISLPNAIPSLNTWYDVVITYDGTNYNMKVGGVSPSPLAASGDIYTNAAPVLLGHAGHSFQGNLSNVHLYKGRVWTAASDFNYLASITPANKGGFPVWAPLPPAIPEDPVPILRPLNKVYEVTTPVTPGQVNLNDPAATTPFTSFYNVAGGVASTDPEIEKYNVADGVSSGSDVAFTSIYSLTGQSSTADIVWSSGDRGYGQVIRTTGSNIYNKFLGRITLAGMKRSSTIGGNIQLGIIKANGTFIGFGTAFAASTLDTSAWTSKTADNLTNANPTGGYACAVGDAVGFLWTSGSGTIYVQRGGSTYFESNTLSCQATFQDDNTLHITNDSYAEAGVFYTGGYTTAVPAYHKMTSTQRVAAIWQTNSVLEGIVPTKWIWRVRRVGSAASATVRCGIGNTAGTVVSFLGPAVSFNSIGTTVQDLVFQNLLNTQPWVDGYRIVLYYEVITGINTTTNYLEVNFNVGSPSGGVIGGTTIKGQLYNGSAYADYSPVQDWAGKGYTGGNSFNPWVPLNVTRTRYGTKINSNVAPVAFGLNRKVTKATMQLRKFGSPVGPIKFIIYGSDNVPKASGFSTIQADTLTTTGVGYDFTWVFNAWINQLNDYMVVEFTTATSTDWVEVMINTDAAAGTSGNAQKMVAVEYVSGVWTPKTDMDVAGIFYEGGIPDLTSRNRVSVWVTSEASIIKGEKITEAMFKFKKTGTVPGNVEIWSRRGSDDSPRDLLGSFPTSDLNTSTWTDKRVINRTALHYLGNSDKISIQYSGGDQTNYVSVMVRLEDTFDGDDTMYGEYDSINWNEPIDNKELVGELWTGGDLYTPDPGTPYVAPPMAYNPNLFILAGGGTNGSTGVPLTMAGMRIRDFRIEAGDVMDSTKLTNWIKNKYSTWDILPGQVALCGYTTLKA